MLKVDIICGLLGAGKTTLIKAMLNTVYAGKKIAVLENELGKVNLDAGEFDRTDMKVEELTSGCVCCSLKAGFNEALCIFSADGSIEYMVVEPSGVADIRDVLDICSQVENVRVNRRIMVVNAKKITRFLKAAGPNFIGQIADVDTIWLNFAAEAGEEGRAAAKEKLWNINPLLTIVECPPEEVAADLFPDAPAFETSPAPTFNPAPAFEPTPAFESAPAFISSPSGTVLKQISPSMLKNEITARELPVPDRLPAEKIRAIADILRGFDEETGIFRAKGYLRSSDGSITKLDLAGGEVFVKYLRQFDEARLNRLVLIGRRRALTPAERLLRKAAAADDSLSTDAQ